MKLPKVVHAALINDEVSLQHIHKLISDAYIIDPEYHKELYNDVRGAR